MKMNIEIISASAGSGKTYTLAQTLKDAIREGTARPEAIVATTFTNKAAAELEERVRTRLLSEGQADQVERLAAARIGTVNSVCEKFVREFAFELGLPQRLEVLDETQAETALKKAMAMVMDEDVQDQVTTLAHRMGGLDFSEAVEEIIKQARLNGLGAGDFPRMADLSVAGCLKLLGKPGSDGNQLEKDLESALKKIEKGLPRILGPGTKPPDCFGHPNYCLSVLRKGQKLTWNAWAKLGNIKFAAKYSEIVDDLLASVSVLEHHPALHSDLEQAIRLAYDLAGRTLESYQDFKKQRGVLDFTDQEALALKILTEEETRKRLEGEIDLVLVDEFQDTSPIQLAIFIALARLAKRSVWVGDQKQAIFGFRGTDPALMDAAVANILKGREPKTLNMSFRSRPELVRLTSDLFAPAFADSDIPASRVKLEPALKTEPAGLGPIIEYWRLQSSNKPTDAAAIATAIRDLLQDKKFKVRDSQTKEPRPLKPRDIAILCRQNAYTTNMANELEARGVPAVIARTGLIAQVETQAVLAGLRLWVNPDDSLARGQIARLFYYPDQADEWLKIVMKDKDKSFEDLPEVRAIIAARAGLVDAGALTALEETIERLSLRTFCLKWGSSGQRLANLDALREYAIQYLGDCQARGLGSTPAGFITYLEELGDEDSQAVLSDSDAVEVVTWHRAKGLEWPVTVLYELNDMIKGDPALGVKTISDAKKIDIENPLAGRWIRYWVSPFGGLSKGQAFFDRLSKSAEEKSGVETEMKQLLRLLYMGWTRARDRVVLTAREGGLADGILSLLKDDKSAFITELTSSPVKWAGRKVDILIRDVEPGVPVESKPVAGSGYAHLGPTEYPEAYISPSEIKIEGKAGKVEKIGERITISGTMNMELQGNAVHGFLAADRAELKDEDRLEIAKGLLTRWEVGSSIKMEDLLQAGKDLKTWIESRWPGAKIHKELPIAMRNPDGSILRGLTDCVIETDKGFVVIDHKSFPGGKDEAVEHAISFAGQLSAYAECIGKAIGKKHMGSFIHLPISGLIVEIISKK